MKTDRESKLVLCTLIAIISALLLGFMTSCTPSAKAAPNIPENELRVVKYEQIIHAYNLLLNRVWVDRPAYVEDCLWDTQEHDNLMELLSEKDKDEIYTFHSIEDSIAYDINWDYTDALGNDPGCVRVIKHVVLDTIPEPISNKLIEVFGNGD